MQLDLGIDICMRGKGMGNERPNMNQMHVSEYVAYKLFKKIILGRIHQKNNCTSYT